MTNIKMQCKIQSGRSFYFFETIERKLKCPKCAREYVKSRTCRNCKTKTQPFNKRHVGKIRKGDITDYTCDCFFSSTIMYSDYWKQQRDKGKGFCKHYREAVNKIKQGEKDEI